MTDGFSWGRAAGAALMIIALLVALVALIALREFIAIWLAEHREGRGDDDGSW